MSDVSVLSREVFVEADAARLLGVPQATLHYWLEGGERRGRTYSPVVRREPKGTRAVTWAEFVEAGLLAQYRRERVPMAQLRAFIELLRDRFGMPYPLADRRPFISGRELVVQAQDEAGLDPEFCLVAPVRGSYLLLPPSDAFLRRVVWSDDLASGWRPHSDPSSHVVVDPLLRFGRPSIRGVSTDVLAEHVAGGETEEEVAADYGLSPADVHDALTFEWRRGEPAAA